MSREPSNVKNVFGEQTELKDCHVIALKVLIGKTRQLVKTALPVIMQIKKG